MNGDDRTALEVAENIERALASFISKEELCKLYKQIKPWLEKLLPIIERIPVIGNALAKAIRLLMMIADLLCG